MYSTQAAGARRAASGAASLPNPARKDRLASSCAIERNSGASSSSHIGRVRAETHSYAKGGLTGKPLLKSTAKGDQYRTAKTACR